MAKINWKEVLIVSGILVIGALVGIFGTVGMINKRFRDNDINLKFGFFNKGFISKDTYE